MNAANYKQWLEQGAALDKKSFAQLDLFVKKYPYCQTARITRTLYLFKNIANSSKEIQLTSIYTNNRIKLHQLLQKSTVKKEITPIANEPITVNETKTKDIPLEKPVINEFKTKEKQENTIEKEPIISKTIEEPIKTKETLPVEESKPKISVTIEKDKQTLLREEIDKRLAEIAKEQQKSAPSGNNSQNDLIDKFIQNEPKISPPKKDAPAEIPDLSEKSTTDNINLVSETLADIHFNQGNYQKALQIYENLILNNPEKSSYFAAQIEKIKALLNNK